jgi:hypothetical protein
LQCALFAAGTPKKNTNSIIMPANRAKNCPPLSLEFLCVPKCGPQIDFCPRARASERERDLQPTESNAKGITQKLTFNPLTLDDSNYCNSFLCLFINRTSSCRRASSCPRYTLRRRLPVAQPTLLPKDSKWQISAKEGKSDSESGNFLSVALKRGKEVFPHPPASLASCRVCFLTK